jgi:hypothetical protein
MSCGAAAADAERVATLRALVAAGLSAALLLWLHPFHGVFAFDPDEGINAIKALLLAHGHALYGNVWNDQPPLFAHLLRVWFEAFGWDVDAGRRLVLCFAASTVFALYDLLRIEAGDAVAAAAAFLLIASAVFGRLSVSLMIGLPAVALATLALWALVRWRQHGATPWLGVAAVSMGAALATKLFVAVLVPVFAVWLTAIGPRAPGRLTRWRAPLLWLTGSAATAAVLLLLLVGPASIDGLVIPHLAARRAPLLAQYGGGGVLLTSMADWPVTVLGVAGAALILLRRRWNLAVFPIWIGTVGLVLLGHAPVWYHHMILLTVPFAAAGGVALASVFRRPPAALPLRAAVAGLAAAALGWAMLPGRLPEPALIGGAAAHVLEEMRALRDSTRTVVATDPMYAFRAGFDVPPGLAVLSLARVATDAHLAVDIQAAFGSPAPRQVILVDRTPSALRDALLAAMGDAYQIRVREPGVTLLVRRDPVLSAPNSAP